MPTPAPPVAIYESEIIPILFEVFRDTRGASGAMVEEYERMYRAMTSNGELTRKKKNKLLEAERAAVQEAITKDFVDAFIDKIFVTPEKDGSMLLNIRISAGDHTQKCLERMKSRTNIADSTGHMFNIMVDAVADLTLEMGLSLCAAGTEESVKHHQKSTIEDDSLQKNSSCHSSGTFRFFKRYGGFVCYNYVYLLS